MSKDIKKQIEHLKTLQESPSPLLSIYFKLPVPKRYTNETIVNKLQTIINAHLTIQERKEMQESIRSVVGFMQKYQQERGEETIAIFISGTNLFEVVHLPYAIKSIVTYSHKPYIDPLLKIQQGNARYLVILSDKKNAIFYTMTDGKVEEKDSMYDESVPQNISHMGAVGLRTQKDDKAQKRIHEHLQKHFSSIAARAQKFIANKQITGVILGGHKNELSQFKKHLPKDLQHKVIGVFVSEIHGDFEEVLQRSKKVIEQMTPKFQYNPSPI